MLKKLLVLSLLVAFIIGCEGYASSPTPKTDRTYAASPTLQVHHAQALDATGGGDGDGDGDGDGGG